jgi:pimeloyl-ACP methyl ester carboxylesterase
VTYDRAGYGASEVGPLPRDSRTEVEELRALLARLKIPRPYILVGHSLGGLNVQVYARFHPEEVAGMVLLVPPPLRFILGEEFTELASVAAQMTDEWQASADRGLHSENAEERTNAEFFQMLASEHREMFNSAQQASSIATFGDIPLVVVASGVPNPMFGDVAESYQDFWAAQSETLAAKSSRGKYVLAETSTHRLHDDAEDLVADRILLMVDSLRGSGH